MRAPLGAALRIALVAALVALVRPPACADWHVSNVTYTYGWDANVNQDVFRPGTDIPMGHIWRTGVAGNYYACAQAYGIAGEYTSEVWTDPHDEPGRDGPGHSNLNARIYLEGSPPPPKPAGWPQKSYLEGYHCILFEEVQAPAGLCGASGHTKTGLMGYYPPTQGHGFSQTWTPPDGIRRMYVDTSSLIDPNWVGRTTQNQYRAAWVFAAARAQVTGEGGIVRCSTKTCATSWGILHNP